MAPVGADRCACPAQSQYNYLKGRTHGRAPTRNKGKKSVQGLFVTSDFYKSFRPGN